MAKLKELAFNLQVEVVWWQNPIPLFLHDVLLCTRHDKTLYQLFFLNEFPSKSGRELIKRRRKKGNEKEEIFFLK